VAGSYGDGTYGSGSYGDPTAAPAAPPSGGLTPKASYTLEIAWNAYSAGIFTFDTSTFDGPDTLGVSPFDFRFTGPNDNMSALFQQAQVIRGSIGGAASTRSAGGSATIELRDPDGICNPDNPLSPLYGQLEDRLHPVRLRGKYGTTRGIFFGWVRRSVWEPSGRRGTARLECVDLCWWLERANPIIPATGPTTTGAALGLVLDSVGWADPASRDLDTGDIIPNFAADGSKSGLLLVQDLLEAERGTFYPNRDGVATYRDRLSRSVYPSRGEITNTMRAIGPGVDFEDAITRVQVTRTQNAYIATATDDIARRKIGYSDLPIETPYLISDTQADDLAGWLLSQLKTARQPIYDLTIDNRTSDLLEQILDRDLIDRVTVTAARGNITAADFIIDELDQTITPFRHSARWVLTRALSTQAFQFDISAFDSADVLVY
jgi:hypothetical protein